MNHRIAALFFTSLLSVSTAFAGNISVSPVNPKFISAMKARAAKKTSASASKTSGGPATGYLPSHVDHSHYAPVSSARLRAQGVYGASATYDLRTLNKVTAVRDQKTCGACWAFATYSSAESSLLTGETWDFSEQNLASLAGFDWGKCGGGNISVATAYLSRGGGPVTEAVDPYYDDSRISVSGLPVVKHMPDVLYLPVMTSASDTATIKSALQTYGAVYASFEWNAAYYNTTSYGYYFPSGGSSAGGHAVAIVGWDDNFAASKFNNVPAGNGAWLVRNQWGTTTSSWGGLANDSGYFYVSYYDKYFGREEVSVVTPAVSTANYKSAYYYDKLGQVGNLGESSSTTYWGGNIFTATGGTTGTEYLKSVGLITTDSGSSYTIYVYRDVSGSPVSGTEVTAARTSGTQTYAGFHTVELSNPVALAKNQKFSIVVKFTNPTYLYPLAIEYRSDGYSSGASMAAGRSYISADGTTWYDGYDLSDLSSDQLSQGINACIKGYSADGPSQVTVYDGAVTGQEVSVTTTTGQISANWTASSGPLAISRYLVSVGTSLSSLNDVKDWTSVGTATSVTFTGLTLSNRTTYYVSVAAEDTGLFRSTSTSSGQMTKFDASCSIALNKTVAPQGPLAITVTADQPLKAGGLTLTVQQAGSSALPVTMATSDNLTYTGTYQVVSGYDGQAAVVAVGTTSAGYTTSSTASFTVDTTSPTASLVLTGTQPLVTGSYTATLTVTDASSISGTPSLGYYRDGTVSPVYAVPLVSSSSSVWTGTISPESYMKDGQYDFSFSATDAAGNIGTQIVSGSSFTIKTSVTNGSGGTISNLDGTQVVLPAYAYAGGISGTLISVAISTPSLSLAALAAANAAALSDGIGIPLSGTGRSANLNRLFIASETVSGVAISTFIADVTIRIPYDVDSAGYVAGTQMKETDLRLFTLNETAMRWELVASSLDTSSTPHAITASVRHFSIYGALGTSTTQDFSSVLVYPNPCDMRQNSSGVTIANLPSTMSGLTIRIYNLAGELVRTLTEGNGITTSGGSRKAVWDGRNSSGDKAASGMYLYVAKGSGGKKTGKIGIIW